jgi:hypothetical protein
MTFFVLSKPEPLTAEDLRGGTCAVKEAGFNTGPALRCPVCNRFLSMLRWLPPYRIELETWGAEYGDFAEVGEELIVSERFADAFQRSDLKGLGKFEEIEINKVTNRGAKLPQSPPRYFKTEVTHSPTTVDQLASGYVWSDNSRICPCCLFDTLKRFARIVIKPESWNGDDIFFPRGGTRLMVSERFKSFCEKHAFLGVVFNSSDQESYEYFPWETQN